MKIKIESIHGELVEINPVEMARSLSWYECCSNSTEVSRDESGEGYISVTYWSEDGSEGPRHWVPAAREKYEAYHRDVRHARHEYAN